MIGHELHRTGTFLVFRRNCFGVVRPMRARSRVRRDGPLLTKLATASLLVRSSDTREPYLMSRSFRSSFWVSYNPVSSAESTAPSQIPTIGDCGTLLKPSELSRYGGPGR